MTKTVSIGKQDFASLREQNSFYIDKTDLIRVWWESQDDITLITRPRRFGKTLNMDMLKCFFSNQYADRGDLFEGLSIWNNQKYQEIARNLSCNLHLVLQILKVRSLIRSKRNRWNLTDSCTII